MSRDLVVVFGVAMLCLSLLAYGLYQRGEAAKAKGELELALAQSKVLGASLDVCTSSTDLMKRLGDQVVGSVRAELAAARKASAGASAQAARLEKLLAQRPPPGAGCNEAWNEIEKGAK